MSENAHCFDMPAGQLKELLQSYGRCCLQENFLDTFYDLFLASSPKVAELFAKTDMDHQKSMLKQSLDWVVMLGSGSEYAQLVVGKTAEKHSSRGLGVQPHLYDLWRKSLITTIEQHDSSFGEELRTIWHKCLTDSIEIMKARY